MSRNRKIKPPDVVFSSIHWGAIYTSAHNYSRHFAESHGLDAVQKRYVWGLEVTRRGFGEAGVPIDFLDHVQKTVREAIEEGRGRPGGHGLPTELQDRYPFEFSR